VCHEDSIMATARSKAGRPPAATDDELLSLLPAPSTAAWQKAANDELGVSKSAFHRALKHLQGHGAVKATGGNWMRS
jgi:predicted ArsR family transcriptional regulator